MDTASTALPTLADVGYEGHWIFTDRYGSSADLTGDFLGMGSSNRPWHNHLFPPYAERGKHCSTCRWTEVRIFQESADPGRYLLVNTGASIVDGEYTFITFGYVDTGYDVVKALTSWRDGIPSIAFFADQALVQASGYDDDIKEAYAERITV